ncbi:MAG: DEAD/DEAH box helicase [Rikenellaceae bacterium]|nr:DEAD/DEAH box helicase [Rikenellaceae bacterium]
MIENDQFRELGLTDTTLGAIRNKGFEAPSPIQRLVIPVLLQNQNDIIGQAQTGTGKTAAFGLPILELFAEKTGVPQALILVPTRELALQVTDELLSFNINKKLSITPIYGGASISEQLRRLNKGTDIVVGTPGRILDHLRRGSLNLTQLHWLVLDEADEMLDMGFIEDVEEIMSHIEEPHRVLLFSATMPDRIKELSKKYMTNVSVLKVESPNITTDLTDQIYFEVKEADKFDALTRIIDVTPDFYGIIFSRTKVGVDELVNKLIDRGYAAEGLHGDVSQSLREKILRKFKRKNSNILVATDVAARGIDISNLSHVINYSLPQDSESYVHRIGRTGRAGNQGTAITFISPAEFRQFSAMKRQVKAEIRKEKLPTPQDIVAMKKSKIMDDLAEIIDGELYGDCGIMAREILANYPPEVALASLLKLAFKGELDESSYPEIRSFSVDRKGSARLFLALGRVDGFSPRKILDLIIRECDLPSNKIDDIKVLDEFSFATVPFSEAERVTRALNNLSKGRPIASMAREKDGESEGKPARKERRRDEKGSKERRRSGERDSKERRKRSDDKRKGEDRRGRKSDKKSTPKRSRK